MAKQQRVARKWKDLTFVANGSDTVDLPLGSDLETIQLYLAGSINVTTAYGAIRSEGISSLIRRVELIVDGKTIVSLPFTVISHGNFMRPWPVVKVNPGIAIGNYTTPEVCGFIDLAHVDGLRPKDSNLRTAGKGQVQLRIIWGALSDMYAGAGAATVALSLQVAIRETREYADELGGAFAPPFLHIQKMAEKSYPTNQQDRIPLDSGVVYRGLLIRAESSGDPSGGVLTNIKVIVGNEEIFNMPTSMLTDANLTDNGVQLPLGYYVVDFAPTPNKSSKISDCLDLTGRNDAFLVMDVVGGASNRVQIISHQFEALTGAVINNTEHRARRKAAGLD